MGAPVSYLDNNVVDMLQFNAFSIYRLNSNPNIPRMKLLNENYFLQYIEGHESKRMRLFVE